MGGRLLDWLGAGNAVDIPDPVTDMPTRVVSNSVALYFATDTKHLFVYDESGPSWYDVDLPTLAGFNNETLQDMIAAFLSNGSGITLTYNDAGNLLTIACTVTQYTDEMAQDAVAAMIAAGADTGLTLIYDDAGNLVNISIAVASSTEIWTGTENAKFLTPQKLKDWRTPVSVTDTSIITLDGTTGVNFYVTLGGNRILANPSNFNPGQFGVIHVVQDGTGSRTLTFGSNWKFPAKSLNGNVLTTTAAAVDTIHYYVRSDGTISCFVLAGLTGAPAKLKLDDLSNVDLSTPPTDGQALVWNNAASKWKAGTVSGGSSTPWYWSPPLASTFTLSNGGGATNMVLTDDTDAGLILEPGTFAAASALSNSFALVALASSTANWTMTARFEGWPNNDFEYNGFGLCLYESGTGKFITHEYQRTYGNINSMSIDKWNSASSFNSTPALQRGQWRWIRVVHASGTYSFQFSNSGKRWLTLYSEGDTAFLAGRADKVGFHMGCARNTGILWQYTCQNFSIV